MIESPQPRLILFHKQKTSARTRFLLLASGSVCAFAPIPTLAEVMDEPPTQSKVALHPGALVHDAETRLGLPTGSLKVMGDFHARVDVADGPLSVYLAGFTTEDPPFAAAATQGGRFIDLPEARMLPPTKLQLLRLAYEHLLGG
jgi:hypothetical protein